MGKEKKTKKNKGQSRQPCDQGRSQTVSYLAQLLSRGKTDLVKQMIKNDLSLVDAADDHHLTPLHHACHAGSFRLAKFLLSRNASLTARDTKGWNPLHCLGASQSEGEIFVKMSHLLLESDQADRALMAKTDSGSTFLHFLLGNMTIDEDEMGDILRVCIRLNADVDAQNEKGEAPLHRAALAGRAAMCRILISEAGARLDVKNKIGQTPLHMGIFAEWVAVCDVLLELGADIQIASEEGTCEDLALQTRNPEMKELFQNYLKNQGNFKRMDNLRKKKVVMGKYRIGERLGSGAFGVVYKGLDLQNGRLVAIKQATRRLVPKKEIPRLHVEVEAMRRLVHPMCVQLYDFEETDQEISFVIEFMSGGSLRDAMDTFGTFPEALLAGYTRDVLIALDFLHANGVVHRDIKAGNILLTNDGRCKLADFGSCFLAEKGKHLSIVGSPYWMSPEMVEGKATTSGKSDIWSLGISIIELVWGHPPHYEKTKMQAMIAIVDLDLPPWAYEELSDKMNDFLVGCFIKLEQFRPSAKELMSHPWCAEKEENGKGGEEAPLPYSHLHDLKKKEEPEEEGKDDTKEEDTEKKSDGSLHLSEPPREGKGEKGKRRLSSSADCLKTGTEKAGVRKLSVSAGRLGEGKEKGKEEDKEDKEDKEENKEEKGKEEEEEEEEEEDDDKYDEEEDEGEKKDEKKEEGKKYDISTSEDLALTKSERESDDDKTLKECGSEYGLRIPPRAGSATDLHRCESDSTIPAVGTSHSFSSRSSGSRTPPRSREGTPPPGSASSEGGAILPRRESSRLLKFHDMSSHQFRQNAPLTVKRSRSPPNGRISSSTTPCNNPPSPLPSPSSPSGLAAKSSPLRKDLDAEEEVGDIEKKGRRTTLLISPSDETEKKEGDGGGNKRFSRVLSVNRLGKGKSKRDSMRSNLKGRSSRKDFRD